MGVAAGGKLAILSVRDKENGPALAATGPDLPFETRAQRASRCGSQSDSPGQ